MTKPMFILELANNHMGSVAAGVRILNAVADVCCEFPEFAFAAKLQYRSPDAFVHPTLRSRTDLPYIKRFTETSLSYEEYLTLRQEIRQCRFAAVCTPFDDGATAQIVGHNYDYIKVPSCYITDWPLLEQVSRSGLPVIASVGGASDEEIERAVLTLGPSLVALLHCVAEYPSAPENLRLHRIAHLRQQYPQLLVGYSTHEDPKNFASTVAAVSQGACVFERHVGLRELGLNAYSCTPEDVRGWLLAARHAYAMLGSAEQPAATTEKVTLHALGRGAWTRAAIATGQCVPAQALKLAMPLMPGQLAAQDLPAATYIAAQDIPADSPIPQGALSPVKEPLSDVVVARQVSLLLQRAGVVIPADIPMEISHHHGREQFARYGMVAFTLATGSYHHKILVLLPGQVHPEQHHLRKIESMQVLWGDFTLCLDGAPHVMARQDLLRIDAQVRHTMTTRHGAVVEEIASAHDVEDTHYTDPSIGPCHLRKTYVENWSTL